MVYEIKVSNICEDYTISGERPADWTCRIEEPTELILLLNRVAIATTQFPTVEFPEVSIRGEANQVQVRAIKGKLFFTDLKASHRKDLVVTPTEVLRLLEGQPVEQALRQKEEDVYRRPTSGGSINTNKVKGGFLLALLLLLLASCFYSWWTLSRQASLVQAPEFVDMRKNEGALLRQYADVYINEVREGATLFELTEDGALLIYELWFSPEKNEYSVVAVASYAVTAGLYQNSPALLAGEVHLLQLSGESIHLHGVAYRRYGKDLSSLGDVVEPGP